jgi:hypothetical protein
MERITTIGPEELKALPLALSNEAPAIPFSEEVLAAHSQTHLLIYTPAGFTINSLREQFGMDPAKNEPCFYNQDWYVGEDFAAKETTDGAWHLLPLVVREEWRAKRPEDIETALVSEERFPTAVTCAFAFFAYWFATGGKKLWVHDFVWCSDRDHNNDRIYVGRYEDPSGVNKNGFNIHRHLALRPAYSAAPEIKP